MSPRHIGDFTPDAKPVDTDPDTFTFCGEEFEIPTTSAVGSFLTYAAMMKDASDNNERGQTALRRAVTVESKARAERIVAESDMTATAAVHRLLTALLGENQMPAFIRAVDRYDVGILDLVALIDQIQGAIADRPTRRSADSSAGPLTTGPTSTADGSGPTDRAYAPPETPLVMSPRDRQVAEIERSSQPLIPVGQGRPHSA